MRINFDYTALQVRNLDESVKFYKEILAMKMLVRKPVKETDGEMCVLKSGTNHLELNWYRGSRVRRGNTLDHLVFEVGTISALRILVKELEEKRIKIHDYLETDRWGRFFIEDPDSNRIEIYAQK